MPRFHFLSFSWFRPLVALVLGVSLTTSSVRAGSAATVAYSTPLERIEKDLPILYPYTLTVTAPSNLPVGTFSVTLDAVLDSSKSGMDPVAADAFVKFQPVTLKFTRVTLDPSVPLPTATAAVTLDVPFGSPLGFYAYQIYTRGWVNDVTGIPHTGFSDGGTAINMTATPPGAPPPPSVSIDAPTDNPATTVNEALFTVTPSEMPKTITLRISATATVAAPILSDNGVIAYIKKITPTDPTPGSPGDLIHGLTITRPDFAPWNAVATKDLVITQPGTYALTALSFNSIGSAEDTDTFRVNVTTPKPQVVIDSPKTNYIYRLGDPALVVPYQFTGTSFFGGLRTLTAKVEGATVANYPTGSDPLGQLVESRAVNLSYTYASAGVYTYALRADATDDNGTADPALGSFTVTVPAPEPQIVYVPHASPAPAVNLPGSVYTLAPGATTITLPWRFDSASKNSYVVDEVKVEQGTTLIQTTLPKTPTATNTGTITVGPGTHTLKATMWTGGSARLSATATVSFEVKAPTTVPPTVVIDTPPVGSVYTRLATEPTLSIPMTFTGTSQTPGAYIKKLTASLNSTPLSVTPTPATLETLQQKSPQGSATMVVSTPGIYTIAVTAEDAHGVATATRTFEVRVVQGRNIYGEAFFDVDTDGIEDAAEFGLSGVTIKLIDASNKVVGTDITDSCGHYSFTNVGPGSYRVVATTPTGLRATTSIDRSVSVAGSNVNVPSMGFGLNFDSIRGMTAGGFTIGFWKNNLDKAIANKTGGTQISKTTLQAYTTKIGDFALVRFDNISMKTASSIMGSSSSTPVDLLAKQLIASEYNYQNGAYLNGNKSLTFLFLYWGEYVLSNPSKYSAEYIIRAKNWFDAYNNTHGGALSGPANP